MVPGYADGDYPEWLRRSALEWFPPDLIEKYAVPIEFSVFNEPVTVNWTAPQKQLPW